MERAGVEERRRAADETERGEHFVELDGALVLLLAFVERQPHRDAHPEVLRRLQTAAVVMNEIAVVERLRAHVGELLIAVETQRGGEFRQIEVQKVRR